MYSRIFERRTLLICLGALMSDRGSSGSRSMREIRSLRGGRFRSGHGVLARQHRSLEAQGRSEEHTSELQSLMRISYAVFCLKQKNTINNRMNMNDEKT